MSKIKSRRQDTQKLYETVKKLIADFTEDEILDALSYFARREGERKYKRLATHLDEWAEQTRVILRD